MPLIDNGLVVCKYMLDNKMLTPLQIRPHSIYSVRTPHRDTEKQHQMIGA